MLVKKLDKAPDGTELYLSLQQLPYRFWLDSARDHGNLGRYSFLGADPFLIFIARGNQIQLISDSQQSRLTGNPLDVLQSLMRQYQLPKGTSPLPFSGGAVGYFGYDLGRQLETLPHHARADIALPDVYLCFYDIVLAIDHVKEEVFLVSSGLPEKDPDLRRKRSVSRLTGMESLLRLVQAKEDFHTTAPEPLISDFTKESYCQAVTKAIDYIAAGDIFVINLSQRLATRQTMPPFGLYRRLRSINPAPFASFLQYPGLTIASASPERFLKVTDGKVQTRPIKGTRPRGSNAVEDATLRRELWNSAKDRAELTMVVDLERNDLGRVCRFGSVSVPELFRLEEYATVFHLVSTVEGKLAPANSAVDLLKAAFPGGSITGAPKIRAMEIIDELEPVRRGIYTGSIGYLDFNGDADLNIVIRTFLLHQEQAYFSVGGGITIDSDPLFEYQETWDKARALLSAIHPAKNWNSQQL